MKTYELMLELEEEKKVLLKWLEAPCDVGDESSGDFGDQGKRTEDIADHETKRRILRKRVDEIELAIKLNQESLVRLCEDCALPISAERIEAMPHACLCQYCQVRQESRVRNPINSARTTSYSSATGFAN